MYTAPNYNTSSQVSDLAATISIEQHQVQWLRLRMTSSFESINPSIIFYQRKGLLGFLLQLKAA